MKKLLHILQVLYHEAACSWGDHDEVGTVVYDDGFVRTTDYKCRWCGAVGDSWTSFGPIRIMLDEEKPCA